MKTIVVKKNREASLLRRHPWLFSGAIEFQGKEPGAGETVMVRDRKGAPLAVAAWSPASQIRARVWSFDVDEAIDRNFFDRRIRAAVQKRQALAEATDRDAYRLVYGESDGLPGLIVDRYGDFLVCQFLACGTDAFRDDITASLAAHVPCLGIYERSDAGVREKEGLPSVQGVLAGEAPPPRIVIREGTSAFEVDVREGHKTGFYLDQADNRAWLGAVAANRTVLNCFSYTGGFGIAALHGGARHVTNVDSSARALDDAASNMARNGFAPERFDNQAANVFEFLRAMKRDGRQFDIVVLDPPKFADGKSQVMQASRAYKDLALQACQLVPAGGLLVTFSCSGAIEPPLFQKITADAFLDAGRDGALVGHLYQGMDHPVSLPFPEALYLKGLVCRVD